MEGESSLRCFRMEESANQKGLLHAPDCCTTPCSIRPSLNPDAPDVDVPVIDLGGLDKDPQLRSDVVKDIENACRRHGFFQVNNHGIKQEVTGGALSAAFRFFELPTEEKVRFMSSDLHQPVRYGSSLKDGLDNVKTWRIVLKHYAHPLQKWIGLWPNNPPDYREKMGKYVVEVRKVAMKIMEAITESLGIDSTYVSKKVDDGMQVMALNCYPPCPRPDLALGLPPHSDYSCISIVLQSSPGLEMMDPRNGSWHLLPNLNSTLQVHVGDQVEVLSNGLYKSVVHRATLNCRTTRISIASLHTLGMNDKMETAKECVDERHPKAYKESSFLDFLNFLSTNDIAEGRRFIEMLEIKQ